MAALRKAILHCQFANLEDALMDRLVCGVCDLLLQRRLLAKDDLTLQKAIDESVAAEAADQSAAEIRKPASPLSPQKPNKVHHDDVTESKTSDSEDEDVHRVKPEHGKHKWPRDLPECAGCGGKHSRSKCRFQDAIYQRCSKWGHIAKVCRSEPSTDALSSPLPKSKGHSRPAAPVSCYSISQCQCSREHMIGQANTTLCKKIHITVTIEGSLCEMEVDIGRPFPWFHGAPSSDWFPEFPSDSLTLGTTFPGWASASFGYHSKTLQVHFDWSLWTDLVPAC